MLLLAALLLADFSTPPPYVPGPTQVLSAIPASGPGVGLCREFWVPTPVVMASGIAGSCARIQMCGSGTTYTILSVNTGSGC